MTHCAHCSLLLLQQAALGLLVDEVCPEALGLVAKRFQRLDLLVNHVLQLLAVRWKRNGIQVSQNSFLSG